VTYNYLFVFLMVTFEFLLVGFIIVAMVIGISFFVGEVIVNTIFSSDIGIFALIVFIISVVLVTFAFVLNKKT
jgi:hypothetical protein